MEPIEVANDLLEWTDPIHVGQRLTSMCHDIPHEFWELWKEYKDELKAAGLRIFREDGDGQFIASWVRRVDQDLTRPARTEVDLPKVIRFLKAPPQFFIESGLGRLHPDQRDATWTLYQAMQQGCPFTLDASDAGMGKTWIALALMRLLGWNFGVVCPANVVTKWTDTALAEPFGLEPEFVLSYERVKSGSHDHLVARKTRRGKTYYDWQPIDKVAVIFDEVHYCSGTDSLNGKLLKGAVDNPSVFVHGLSATVADSPLDMRAVGYGLQLHDWKGWWKWCQQMGCRPGHFGGLQFNTGIDDDPTVNQKRARAKLALIHSQIFPARGTRITVADSTLWRPKNHVMAEIIDVDQSHPEIQEAIDSIIQTEEDDLERAEERGNDVSALTINVRDRQRAEVCKLPYLRRRILDLRREGNSVVVFLNYSRSIEWLLQFVGECSVIRGGLSNTDRNEAIRQFQSNERRIAVCQTDAGGQSIDLDDQVGDYPRCSLISPTYSAKRFYQVIGRPYRPASTKSMVRQWILFAAGTVEEQVGRVVQAKFHAQSLINDGDLSPVILVK